MTTSLIQRNIVLVLVQYRDIGGVESILFIFITTFVLQSTFLGPFKYINASPRIPEWYQEIRRSSYTMELSLIAMK